MLRLFQQTESVTYDLAGCSVAPQRMSITLSILSITHYICNIKWCITHEIGEDYILGRSWDEMYVEYAQLWGLER